MQKINIKFNNQVIAVEINNSQTAKDFISKLPLSLKMERYDDREYFSILDFHLSLEGEHIKDFTNGDVTYFPELNSLAIFFAKEGVSSQPGLIRVGRITSDLGVLQTLEDQVDFEISAIE